MEANQKKALRTLKNAIENVEKIEVELKLINKLFILNIRCQVHLFQSCQFSLFVFARFVGK